MRLRLLALAVLAALAGPRGGSAAPPPAFADAPLHAVQFVDAQEGWAAGADGAVWHSIDGGATWERQPTGTRATLRAIHFVTPWTGWAVGREEVPHGAGSVGVVLLTTDGGDKWERVDGNRLPGLHAVKFFDDRVGVAAGDSSGQHPSGLFLTRDGGRSWKAVPGPRVPGWLGADFSSHHEGALAGAWSRLATLREGVFGAADVDTLGGRGVHALKLDGPRAVAAGQGGLVLLSSSSAGVRWGYADLRLPPEVTACLDFDAVAIHGDHVWIAGRPGSVVLHSADAGRHWELQQTGQPLPIHGLHFANAKQGWAVGELGTVLLTEDGGQTWKAKRQGPDRAAVLCVHAKADAVPFDATAAVGGAEGYAVAALRVAAPDPTSAEPRLASEPQRFEAALRACGGVAAECLWQFPLPAHLDGKLAPDLAAYWDRLHGGRAGDELLRQIVLGLRVWRPEVVITDAADPGRPADCLVAEAVRKAFDLAADPKVFPEQLTTLGLRPWEVKKLYAPAAPRTPNSVTVDVSAVRHELGDTPRDVARTPAGMFAEVPADSPAERCFQLVAARLPGAAGHRTLLEGLTLAAGGTARREVAAVGPAEAEAAGKLARALQSRRSLQDLLAASESSPLAKPELVLSRLAPVLDGLPEEHGAAAAYAVADGLARAGHWPLAREAFLMMADRYPAHPLTADAYRWLARYHASTEARRRQELGQFLAVGETEYRPGVRKNGGAETRAASGIQQTSLMLLGDSQSARRWFEGSLEVEPRLAGFGLLFANDPQLQFSLAAARRHLGEFDKASKWYSRFLGDTAAAGPKGGRDPWREAAEAELWLTNRSGPPPRPVSPCKFTALRPFLDGRLTDACWQSNTGMKLADAAGESAADCPTKAWLAYDRQFLYLAVQCKTPAGGQPALVKKRDRDTDLRPFDRVSLFLDLDRDYQTCYHLQIDQRGCVAEDCWGDRKWNPRWFVSVSQSDDGWTAEAAIPLQELTGDAVSLGTTWAANVTRTIPGRGVQGWSLPADATPRPEGLGLVTFQDEDAPAPAVAPPTPGAPRPLPPSLMQKQD